MMLLVVKLIFIIVKFIFITVKFIFMIVKSFFLMFVNRKQSIVSSMVYKSKGVASLMKF
jgi:hypothetical protein